MTGPVAKRAVDPQTCRTPTYYYDSARAAVQDLLAALATTRGHSPRVLLPSFVGWSPNEGSGVFDPVRALGLEAGFYAVESDLGVDLADLESRLAGGRYDVVVVIHYFGRTQPGLAAVVDVAHQCGAVVLEDLAHGFFTAQGGGPAGRSGDVSVYSVHKMFPTPATEGGFATYRQAGLVSGQRSTRPDLAGFLLDFDWRAIAEIRRANFLALADGLASLPSHGREFELMWPALSPHDVPQTLPVRIRGGGRDGIYHAMNARGLGMVSLYHTLIPELAGFAEMGDLARTIINFPVHQDVRPEQVPHLVAAFAEVLAEGGTA